MWSTTYKATILREDLVITDQWLETKFLVGLKKCYGRTLNLRRLLKRMALTYVNLIFEENETDHGQAAKLLLSAQYLIMAIIALTTDV